MTKSRKELLKIVKKKPWRDRSIIQRISRT